MADVSAEGAEDHGEGLLDDRAELVFGAARGIGEGREGDRKGTGGEIGRGRPGIGDGEQDGALDEYLERLALARLAVGDADAAGEPAQRIDGSRGERADVVEGEDPVDTGQSEELAGGGRKRSEGRSGGIDQGAQN